MQAIFQYCIVLQKTLTVICNIVLYCKYCAVEATPNQGMSERLRAMAVQTAWLPRIFLQWKEQWLARLYSRLRKKSVAFEAWLHYCSQQKERRPSCVQSAVVTRRKRTPIRSGSTPPPPPHPPLEDVFHDLDESSSFYNSPSPVVVRPVASPSPSPKSAAHLPAPYQKATIHPRHPVWNWEEEEEEDMSRPEEVSAQRLRKGKSLRALVNPKRAGGGADMADGLYFGRLCRRAMMRLHMLVAMSCQRPPAAAGSVPCDLFERQWGYQAAFTTKKKQVDAFRRAALDGLLPRWHKWALVETWIKHEYLQATAHDRVKTLSKGWGVFNSNITMMMQQHQLTVAAKCLSRERRGTRFLAKLQRRVAGTRDAASRLKTSTFGTAVQRALRRWSTFSQRSVDRYIELFDLAAKATNALELRKKWQTVRLWVSLLARRAKRRIAWVPKARDEPRIVDWAARSCTSSPYWIPTRSIELGVEHRYQNDRLAASLKTWS